MAVVDLAILGRHRVRWQEGVEHRVQALSCLDRFRLIFLLSRRHRYDHFLSLCCTLFSSVISYPDNSEYGFIDLACEFDRCHT